MLEQKIGEYSESTQVAGFANTAEIEHGKFRLGGSKKGDYTIPITFKILF